MKELSEKKLSELIRALFKKTCTGYTFGVIDLSKISKLTRVILEVGSSPEEAEEVMILARDKYKLTEPTVKTEELKRGWWSLDTGDFNSNELSETTLEHIAEQIKDGMTSGEILEG